MPQKLPVNNVAWIENNSQLNEDFIKNSNEEFNEGYCLEVDVQHPKKLHELHNDLSFLPESIKIEKVEKLIANLYGKLNLVRA